MRKLFILIAKNYVLLGFLALEFLSFSLILNTNYYQDSTFYNWTNQQASSVHEKINSIKHYFLLNKVNESLLETNAKLLTDNKYLDKQWELKLEYELAKESARFYFIIEYSR